MGKHSETVLISRGDEVLLEMSKDQNKLENLKKMLQRKNADNQAEQNNSEPKANEQQTPNNEERKLASNPSMQSFAQLSPNQIA